MKVMRKLWDQCMEELDGSMEYSRCAMMHASRHPEVSKMYLEMAKDELGHAQRLHEMSKELAKSKVGTEDVDPRLMELWEEMECAKIEKMGLARACYDTASA